MIMPKDQAELDAKAERRARELRGHGYRILETHTDPETGAGVVLTTPSFGQDKVHAHFFRARQLRRGFRTEEVTSNHQRLGVMSRLRSLLQMEKDAKVAPHDLQVGEIIANIWGHTMQNVRFYQVVGIPHPRQVEVVLLPDRLASGDWMAGTKMPVASDGIPKGERLTYDVSMETGEARLKTGTDIERARRWDGNPVQVYSD